MVNFLIGAGILACALMAVRENRLLIAALWLALTSALVSFLMYRLGAADVAVIELSVGAGLVTVLFVFAINIAGDVSLDPHAPIPQLLSWVAVILSVLLLAWMVLPALQLEQYLELFSAAGEPGGMLRTVLWGERSADLLMQVVLIFGGVLALVGLISGGKQEKDREENHP